VTRLRALPLLTSLALATPLQITVRLTAPAVPGYSKMDITYAYTTG